MNTTSQQLHLLKRQEMEKEGKMLTKAALTMPRDLSSSQAHLNHSFRLGFMQVYHFVYKKFGKKMILL